MAVTLGNGNITYGDGTSIATRATVIGAVQYTGYSNAYFSGYQGWQTTEAITAFFFSTFGSGVDFNSTLVIGQSSYRASSRDATSDGRADQGLIYYRTAYRTVTL